MHRTFFVCELTWLITSAQYSTDFTTCESSNNVPWLAAAILAYFRLSANLINQPRLGDVKAFHCKSRDCPQINWFIV